MTVTLDDHHDAYWVLKIYTIAYAPMQGRGSCIYPDPAQYLIPPISEPQKERGSNAGYSHMIGA